MSDFHSLLTSRIWYTRLGIDLWPRCGHHSGVAQEEKSLQIDQTDCPLFACPKKTCLPETKQCPVVTAGRPTAGRAARRALQSDDLNLAVDKLQLFVSDFMVQWSEASGSPKRRKEEGKQGRGGRHRRYPVLLSMR